MKRLDRFILTGFIGPFFMILLVVIFILLMQFLWVYIDELVGKGLSFSVIAEFLWWGSCTVLPLALPLATLLAAMMTIGQMGENNELIAMKAAGLSLMRIMMPVLIASAVISVGTFFVINKLVPVAYNKIYTLRDDIKKTKNEIKIPSGVFYDGVEGYVLRVKNTSSNGMMHDVMLYDHSGNRGNTRLTLADSAIMQMSKDKTYITFKMYDGINYQEDNKLNAKDTALQLQRVDFTKQEMVIPLENYAFQKSDTARFGDQVKALPLRALKVEKDSLTVVRDSATRSQLKFMAAPSALTLRSQLDTSIKSGITQDFSDEDFLNFSSKTAMGEAYRRAAEVTQQIQSQLVNYQFDSYNYTVRLRYAKVEYFRRYGQALACFVMFFIGAPVGALIKKGGVGVSAIVSVLFFVLYWIIDITGVKLARDGSVSAWVGAFSSSLVLFAIGLFLTWKAVHDSEIFNGDNIKNNWRKIKSKIAGFFRKTRIIYMGTPEFAVEPLKALLENRYKVVAVVTVADKPIGRGQKMGESAVKKFAVERGIPVLQPLKLKDPEFLQQLRSYKADLFIVVAFRMLPEEVWSMPKLGTFNLHAALLPQYRGAAPINWAVINGEQRTGATTFMIDKNIDTGGIILRQSIRIGENETAGDIHDRLMKIGADLVVQTAEGIIEHTADTRVQRSFIQGSEVLKPAPKLTKELCHIDWNDTTKQIFNLIRGLSPYPAAFTELAAEGKEPAQLKIFTSEKVAEDDFMNMLNSAGMSSATPGAIISDGKSFMAIATADGAISLKEVQLAGKKRMDIRSFLAGFRNIETYKTTEGTSKAEIAKTRS
jgi:methionyl-tRNA formyltransferase